MTGSIGEQLKQARIEKGLSLDQASQTTHIRKFYLEALEEDQRSVLPSNVQGRGFLRLYADLVGLAIDPLLAAWDGKSEVQNPPEKVPASPAAEAPTAGALAAPDNRSNTPPPNKPENIAPLAEAQPTAEAGMDSAFIFREIGAKLRKQREALGLTLVEVERYTRLRQHYITAMEEGTMENMPSPVQGRGMLSNYAAFLNLDEEKVLLRFAEGLQVRRIERIAKAAPPGVFSGKKKAAKQAPVWRRFLTPDLIFGVGLAAIILFFILWTAARIDNLRHTSVEPTTPAIAELLLTPADAGTAVANSTKPVGQVTSQGDNAGQALPDAITPTLPLPTITLLAVLAPTGNGQPGVTVTVSAMNSDPLQVYIVAKQRAWLRVTADDKIKFLGRVVPGNAYAFSGTKRVELLTGNAAGLQIFYNQSDLGTLGDMGQVVGLIFVPGGMMTPTPAAPPPATATSIPTITALPSTTPKATATVTPFVP
jgi:cytoskeleton protein RodZ